MIGDPYFRRLSGDEKENIAPVVKATSEVGDVLEYAEEKFNKILTSTDVYNLRKDVRPAMPLRPDVIRIIRQSGQVAEYVDSNTGITNRICFALDSQVQLYRKYGEVVCIDSTYNTNKDGYSLFQLVVTDNMGHGRPVFLAWTRRERACDVAWILEEFKRMMQNTSITETFIMDSASCEISAVRNSQIQAKIVICAFHVCRAFSRKTRNPFVRRFLYRLVKAATPERFYHYLSVIRTVDRRVWNYVRRYWVPKKETWATAYMPNTLLLFNSTNNRVESSHSHLKRYLHRRDPLHVCMYKTYKWCVRVEKRRSVEAIVESCRTHKYHAPEPVMPILRNFTPYAAKLIAKDYSRNRRMSIELYTDDMAIINDDIYLHQVEYTNSSCTCRTFRAQRIPCRHMLLVHTLIPQFTVEKVLRLCRRWFWRDPLLPISVPCESSVKKPCREILQLRRQFNRSFAVMQDNYSNEYTISALRATLNYFQNFLV
uniref:SWIM-type domain-containing protein n=1 Tax=Trichobilharzia regenti TaxID=157069 RepID=A0AA85K1Z6_TRIRE|nr:unnamed protein product [Trichobilharzia regenti]